MPRNSSKIISKIFLFSWGLACLRKLFRAGSNDWENLPFGRTWGKIVANPQTVFVTEEILLDLADFQTPQGIVAISSKRRGVVAGFYLVNIFFLEDVGSWKWGPWYGRQEGRFRVIVSSKSARISTVSRLFRSMQWVIYFIYLFIGCLLIHLLKRRRRNICRF